MIGTYPTTDWTGPTAPAWNANLFLINTIATHPSSDVDHIAYTNPHPWGNNVLFSQYVSSTSFWDAAPQLTLSNPYGIADAPQTINAGATLYDSAWNVSWWFAGNGWVPTVQTPSISWVNHATNTIRYDAGAWQHSPSYSSAIIVESRSIVVWTNGTRVNYTPRSNHPFGPVGFSSSLVQYVDIPGVTVFSMLYVADSDSLLLGCSFGLLVELNLGSLTITSTNRLASLDPTASSAQAWIAWLEVDPSNSDVVWWQSNWFSSQVIGRFLISSKSSYTAHFTVPPTNGLFPSSGKYYAGGTFTWVGSSLWTPGSNYLRYAGATGTTSTYPFTYTTADATTYSSLAPWYTRTITHDCSALTSCSACLSDTSYCGWCSLSQMCSDSSSGCSVSGDSWSKTYDCPLSTSASPTTVPPEGGINVTLSGASMKTGLTCEWSQAVGANTSVASTGATSSSVDCLVPAADPSIPSYSTASSTLHVQLKANGTDWGTAYSLTYIQCRAYNSCSTCIAAGTGCGWCLGTNLCSHQTLCSSANTWSRACPSIDSISPTTISAVGGETITITGSNLFSGSSAQYALRFDSLSAVPVTYGASSDSSSSKRAVLAILDSTMTAVVPALSSTTGPISITLLKVPDNTVVATNTSALSSYDCTAQTTCSACFSTGSRCNWCTTDNTCVDSSVVSTCSTNSGSCPVLTSASPALTFLNDALADLTLTGLNLAQLPTANLQCIFKPTVSGSTAVSAVTQVTATSATCKTITTPVGVYALSLGYGSVPSTNSTTYEVYDCTSNPCSSCLATGKASKCSWCNDVAGGQVGCMSIGSSCSATFTALTQCPFISSVAPTDISSGTSSTVTLTGQFSTLSAGTPNCTFHSPDTSASPTVVGTTSVSTTAVTCDSTSFAQTGNWTVNVELSGNAYTAPSNFSVFNCAGYTNCFTCSLASQCGWVTTTGCVSRTSSTINTASSCPRMSSVTPNVGLKSGGDSVVVIGGPFAEGTGLYTCLFGTGSITNSTTSTSTYVTCTTPSVSQPISTTLTVLLADESTSATITSPLAFTFVDCPVFTSSQCSDACVSFPDANGAVLEGCGFCTGSGLCTAQGRCASLWVPECFNPLQVLPSFALLDGEDTLSLTVTESPVMPLNQSIVASDLTCSFGSSTTSAALVTTAANTATVSCKAPAVSSAQTVAFSVNYRSSGLTSTLGYTFADCTTATSCSSCLAMKPCGWCIDTQSCTTSTRCPLGNYTSATCPDVFSLVPSQGSLDGGTSVRIIGILFIPNPLLQVRWGSNVLKPTFIDNTTLSITTPSHSRAEKISVALWFNGTQYSSSSVSFSFVTPSGLSRAGTIGLAVGLTLGLLLLLSVVIAIAIVLYRRKARGALIFNVREPDYTLVAFGPPAELNYRIPSDNYRLLEQLLCSHNFGLQVALAAVSPPTEEDIIAKSMLYVAQSHGISVGMINALVKGEIARCREENTIFRSNSVASKTFKFYSRVVGIHYLWKCMARVIYELEVLGNRANSGKKEESSSTSLLRMTMEVDMERYNDTNTAHNDIDSEVNVLQLKLTCQKLFSVLVKNGVSDIPAEFRQIFVEIDSEIMKKFNSDMAVYKAIGGFFFLRFVCPSITAPHYYGLLDRPPNETTQRQLVLISKVIQSLANMQMPGRKEAYMESMSDFIEKNMGSVVKFYQDMREASRVNVGRQASMEVPDTVRLNALASIMEFIHSYRPKIENELGNTPDDTDRANLEREFAQVVEQYPKPKKSATADAAASSKSPRSSRKKRAKPVATSS